MVVLLTPGINHRPRLTRESHSPAPPKIEEETLSKREGGLVFPDIIVFMLINPYSCKLFLNKKFRKIKKMIRGVVEIQKPAERTQQTDNRGGMRPTKQQYPPRPQETKGLPERHQGIYQMLDDIKERHRIVAAVWN